MKLKKIIKYFYPTINLHIYGKDNKFYGSMNARCAFDNEYVKNLHVNKIDIEEDKLYIYLKEELNDINGA